MPNGSYWVGRGGFNYKRSGGGGNHRIFSLGAIANQPQNVNNTYVPGAGVGASSIANRRARLLHSTVCNSQYPCNKSFSRLGLQSSGGSNDYAYNWYLNDVYPNPYPVAPTMPPSTTITSLYYGYRQATLTWSSVSSGYIIIVQYSTDNTNWITFTTLSSSQTTTTVTGLLLSAATYYFRIGVSDFPTTGRVTYSSSASTTMPFWSIHDLVPNTSLTTGNTAGITTVIGSGSSSATTVVTDIFNRNGTYNISASSILTTGSQPSYYPYLVFESTNVNNNPNKDIGETNAFWNSGGNTYNTTGAYTGSVSTSVDGVGDILGEWLQVQPPFNSVMRSYRMSSRKNFGYRMPKNFYIVGSHDGSTWYYVDQQTVTTSWNDTPVPTTAKSFTVSTTNTSSLTAYTYFRIIVNSVANGGGGGSTNAQTVNIYTFVPVCYISV